MLVAIAGDVIGSVHEHDPIKTKTFPLVVPAARFTDDGVSVRGSERTAPGGRPDRR